VPIGDVFENCFNFHSASALALQELNYNVMFIKEDLPHRIFPNPLITQAPVSLQTPTMRSAPLPYILEDRSGIYNASDFDDIYDRLFLRIAESSHDAETSVSMIYDMGRRSSRRPDSRHFDRQPAVVLDFGANGKLGNVHFMQPPAACSLPMYQYLRKTTIFGG
jgi:hypothetical protein